MMPVRQWNTVVTPAKPPTKTLRFAGHPGRAGATDAAAEVSLPDEYARELGHNTTVQTNRAGCDRHSQRQHGRTVVVVELRRNKIGQKNTGICSFQNLRQHLARAWNDVCLLLQVFCLEERNRLGDSPLQRHSPEGERGGSAHETHSSAASAAGQSITSQPNGSCSTPTRAVVIDGGTYCSSGSAPVGSSALPDMCSHTVRALSSARVTGMLHEGDASAATTSAAHAALMPAAATMLMRPAAAWAEMERKEE